MRTQNGNAAYEGPRRRAKPILFAHRSEQHCSAEDEGYHSLGRAPTPAKYGLHMRSQQSRQKQRKQPEKILMSGNGLKVEELGGVGGDVEVQAVVSEVVAGADVLFLAETFGEGPVMGREVGDG